LDVSCFCRETDISLPFAGNDLFAREVEVFDEEAARSFERSPAP
jgi:hypothetical protein